jgi:hypothetical protein
MTTFEHILWKILTVGFTLGMVYVIVSAFSGCTAMVPLGERGKYGSLGLSVSYYPPVNILQEQPNIGGFAK